LYRVERVTGVRSRLRDLEILAHAVRWPGGERNSPRTGGQKRKGRGQLVMITGEAGIGKSACSSSSRKTGNPHTWIEGNLLLRTGHAFRSDPDLVANALHWTQDTTAEEKSTRSNSHFLWQA
jgi:hypothetical protein